MVFSSRQEIKSCQKNNGLNYSEMFSLLNLSFSSFPKIYVACSEFLFLVRNVKETLYSKWLLTINSFVIKRWNINYH